MYYKFYKSFIGIFFFIICLDVLHEELNAQSCGDCIGFVNASANTTNICAGQPVTVFAEGDGYAYANNFNNQTLGPGWVSNITPQFNNPCGPGLDGSPHLWMGSSTAAPRLLETMDMNTTGGGNISFDLRFAIQGGASPCEGPDEPSEGVYLDYSTNGGGTWTNIFYFNPVPLGTYTSWANYSFPIPPAAQTPCTRFRWYQGGSSGNAFDHWGLDNIQIGPALPPGAVNLYWENNGQAALPSEVIYPQSDTILILVLETPIDTCRDTLQIFVSTPPVANLTFQPQPACAGQPISFIASGSTGTIDQVRYDLDNNGTYEYTLNAPGDTTFNILIPGLYTIRMQVVAPGGCTNSNTFPLTINPQPTLDLTALPLAVCLGTAITLRDSSSLINPLSLNTNIANFSWDFQNDGIIDSITLGTQVTGPPIITKVSSFSYVFSAPGTYEILSTVTTTGGCKASDSITITIYDLPQAGFIHSGNVCDGNSVTFTDTSLITPPDVINNYSWSFTSTDPAYSETSSEQNPIMNFPSSGTYYITLSTYTANGCADTSVIDSVTIFPNPIADFSFVTQCFQTNILQQTATPSTGLTYAWDLDQDGTIDENQPSFTYVFPDSSDKLVTLIVIDTNNCTSDTTKLVDVKGGVENPTLPNVLSLSSSINNKFDFQLFAPGFNECITYTLSIFNRWGIKVFETINNANNPDLQCNDCFTGLSKTGSQLVPGVYYYVLKGSNDIELNGTIHIFE